jgi:hypothetical protein
MSGSSRSRSKHKLEPISIEELAGTTGMSGFCTFLTRDSSVPVPALDRAHEVIETGAPVSSAPVLDAPGLLALTQTAPDQSAPDPGAPILSAPDSSGTPETSEKAVAFKSAAPDSRALDSDALETDPPDSTAPYSLIRPKRIREAATVQDGHSLAEQAVYDAMYRAGRPHQGDSRILTIGLRTLAEMSRMAYSNCKANVRSLIAKLAIDEHPGFSYIDGRTYTIYSFREILRRRKGAGLTHVLRTRGVAFCDPVTGTPLLESDASVKGAGISGAPVSSAPGLTASLSIHSAPATVKSGAPLQPQSSAPATGALIGNRHWIRKAEEKSSSVPEPIVTSLRRYISDVDDDAALDLWRRCLEEAPGATAAEVAYFIELKAGKPGIRMPLGFLLTAVPKCFKGDSYRQFREEKTRGREEALSRDWRFAEEVLRSPDADEEQREWAREVLALPSAKIRQDLPRR